MTDDRCGAHPRPVELIPASALDDIAVTLRSAAERSDGAMQDAAQQWTGLQEAFQVAGTSGVFEMMETPKYDVGDHVRALRAAADRLSSYARAFDTMRERRRKLLVEFDAVIAEHDALRSALDRAEDAWAVRRQLDPIQPGQQDKPSEWHAYMSAKSDWDQHRDREHRVGRENLDFNLQVDDEERDLARELRGIDGGDVVTDVGGGAFTALPPMQAFGIRPSLADRLQTDLVDSALTRLRSMTRWSTDDLTRWINGHPDFASVIPLIPPAHARELWNSWEAASSFDPRARNSTGRWANGPLALFFAAAPVMVGNLSGVPSAERHRFNVEALERAAAADGLDDDQRLELRHLGDAVRDGGRLLNFFVDTNGEARAAVAFGDVEHASVIVTLTHGIETDVTQGRDWFQSASSLRDDVTQELRRTGLGGADQAGSIATVAYFGWNSGTKDTVVRSDIAFGGALIYSNFVTGLREANPNARVEGWFHSYGTTMGAESLALDSSVLDGVHNFGSAGYREDTRRMIEAQFDHGGSQVTSAHADRDWTAGMGRRDHPLVPLVDLTQGRSTHDFDPRKLSGGSQFSAADGNVTFTYPVSGAPSRSVTTVDTEGHGSHRHADPIMEAIFGVADFTMLGDLDAAVEVFEPKDDGYLRFAQDGYLSRQSTSYQQAFADLVARYYDVKEGG